MKPCASKVVLGRATGTTLEVQENVQAKKLTKLTAKVQHRVWPYGLTATKMFVQSQQNAITELNILSKVNHPMLVKMHYAY